LCTRTEQAAEVQRSLYSLDKAISVKSNLKYAIDSHNYEKIESYAQLTTPQQQVQFSEKLKDETLKEKNQLSAIAKNTSVITENMKRMTNK